jgi:RNA polymerase sigma factor (sigma-70 family)
MAAQRGRRDVEATNSEIYRKHADDLTRFATALVGPSHASDVVSDGVLRCLGSPNWYRVGDKRAYLFRSVYHEAARFHQASSRRRAREQRAARTEHVDPPDVRPEVLAAVGRLSTRQRAVIVLTYWNDLDPSAIATMLKISTGSVKRHLARGRSHLKEALDADD